MKADFKYRNFYHMFEDLWLTHCLNKDIGPCTLPHVLDKVLLIQLSFYLSITGHFEWRIEDKKETSFKTLTGCIFLIIIRFIIIVASAFIFSMSKQL